VAKSPPDGVGAADGAGKTMSLFDHLEELRWTLIRCILAAAVCAVPCWVYWRRIFDALAVWPLRHSVPAPRIIFTAPAEAVMLSVKIAVAGGALLASPFIFQQLWTFISPGLYKKEKTAILPVAIASTVCFLAGIAFCYCLLPLLLKFLTGFAGGRVDPLFKIGEYFDFLIKMCLAFGLVFEMPVVAFALSKMGVIDYRFLIKYGRHAILLMFIVAAVLTPPDVLSQVLLALPLLALYGISVLVAFLAGKR
jgi:sec-independent protein translocase protein TatC